MRDILRRFPHCPSIHAFCALGATALLFAGCGRAPVTASAPPPRATPDPHETALIEHMVRDRLAEENRITEQRLVNARAAASQKMVGKQMFLKLEDDYRERQAEISGRADAAPATTPVLLAQIEAQPSASPVASATPQAPAPVETAGQPDAKLQHPPVEDHADSMKGSTKEQLSPTPIPSPTAPAAPQNGAGAGEGTSPPSKPTPTPK